MGVDLYIGMPKSSSGVAKVRVRYFPIHALEPLFELDDWGMGEWHPNDDDLIFIYKALQEERELENKVLDTQDNDFDRAYSSWSKLDAWISTLREVQAIRENGVDAYFYIA